MKKTKCCCPERLGKVGGQAVMEGVMMRSGENVSVAVRNEDKSITVVNDRFVSVRKKHKILNIPVLRGIVNFVEMMKLSFKTLNISADAFVGEAFEEEPTKFEKWVEKHFGKNILDVVMAISMVLGVILGVGLFILLPSAVVGGIDSLCGGVLSKLNLFALIEGVIRIAIFILYIYLVSLMSYIRRTFEYHGAEHKSIACYEAGDELTAENAKKHTRFHPRCGTSFMFVIMILSIFIFTATRMLFSALADNLFLYWASKIILVPLVVGIGFEFIMYAGKHDNPIVSILSAPGLWMQRITTREPDLEQLEVAIAAIKAAMPDQFPPEEGENTLESAVKDGAKEAVGGDTAEDGVTKSTADTNSSDTTTASESKNSSTNEAE